MLRWLLRRQIAAYERKYDYDMSYVRDILEVSPWAALAFARAARLARYGRDVPVEAMIAAKLAVALAEDCGPCTQLVVTMAERWGVAPAALRAILAGETAAMTADAALSFRFARAVLGHHREAEELRDDVTRRWGRGAAVTLAFAIAGSRLFPTVKYALGHGRACARVKVDGVAMPVLRRAA